MDIGYRSILRLNDDQNAIDVAEEQLVAWLRTKRRSGIEETDWDGPGAHRLGPNATLTVVEFNGNDDSRRRLYRLQECNDAGTWEVTIYAFDLPKSRQYKQSLVVEAATDSAKDASHAVSRVDPPRLVRMILETYEAKDGAARLTGRPILVNNENASEVVSAIRDQDRTAAVIVAPTPWAGQHESAWIKVVESLTRDSVGVASTFILDASATDAVVSHLPDSHAVAKGVIRTFAPRVDEFLPEDRLRHRMLFPDTLARSINSNQKVAKPLAKRHAEATRNRFIHRELPTDLRRGIDILRREEVSQERQHAIKTKITQRQNAQYDAPTPVPPSPKRASTGDSGQRDRAILQRVAGLVKRWIGTDGPVNEASVLELDQKMEAQSIELEMLTEQYNVLDETNGNLRDQLEETKEQFDELQLGITIAEDTSREHEREISALRKRLIDANAAEKAFITPLPDKWKAPDDMYELISRITPGTNTHGAFSRVVFTGDEEVTYEIETRGQGLRYAHAFWDYIHVLHDYAAGKSKGHVKCGVHQYLKSDHLDGHKCSADRHAPTESDQTLARWGNERIFPVPSTVASNEEIQMVAHFKPTWSDTFAPRMYYYDDTDNTGKIYVGYIGRHLKNTKTS